MANNIIGALSLTSSEYEEKTLRYLRKIAIVSDKLKKGYKITDEYLYEIEFKESVNILGTLRSCGYFKKNNYVDIHNISEEGFTFYLVDQYMGDGFLFVPMNNIKAIHTINKENLKGLITETDPWD